jgi:hypothetical protein
MHGQKTSLYCAYCWWFYSNCKLLHCMNSVKRGQFISRPWFGDSACLRQLNSSDSAQNSETLCDAELWSCRLCCFILGSGRSAPLQTLGSNSRLASCVFSKLHLYIALMHFTKLLSSRQCECDCNAPLLYVTFYLHTISNWTSFYEIYWSLFSTSTNFFHGINHRISTIIHIQQASWLISSAWKSTQDVILLVSNPYVGISHVSRDLLRFSEGIVRSNKPVLGIRSLCTVIMAVLLLFHTFLYPPSILQFLGAFAKLRKVIISFVISVRPSFGLSAWSNSTTTWYIFTNFFYIWKFFRKSVKRIQVLLKSEKQRGYLIWRPIYIFIISRSFLLRMKKIVSDKNCRENQNIHFVFNNFFFRKFYGFFS